MKRHFLKIFSLVATVVVLGISQLSHAALDNPEPSANGTYQIVANWSELKRGWNLLTFQVLDASSKLAAIQSLAVTYDMTDMQMDPPDNPIVDKGEGLYEKKIFLGMSGGWKFDFMINQKTISEDTFTKTQTIK